MGWARILPRYVGQHLLQSQPHPGCPVRRQILCQHGVGEIQQPDIEGRARMGRLCWRRAGPEAPGSPADRQASARDGPMAARQQIGLHGRGEQAGIAAAPPPCHSQGIRASSQRGATGQLHGVTVMTSLPWDGLCDGDVPAGWPAEQQPGQGQWPGVELLVGPGEDLGPGEGLQGVDGLVDGGGSPRLRARK